MNLCNMLYTYAIDQTGKVIYKPKQCRVSNIATSAAVLLLT